MADDFMPFQPPQGPQNYVQSNEPIPAMAGLDVQAPRYRAEPITMPKTPPIASFKPGFWENFAVTYAAAKGNVGPFVQLKQNERKAAVYSRIPAIRAQAGLMIKMGDPEGATKFWEEQTSQFASDPEFGQFIGPMSAQIAEAQEYKILLNQLTSRYEALASDENTKMPEAAKQHFKFWSKMLKSEAPYGKVKDLQAMNEKIMSGVNQTFAPNEFASVTQSITGGSSVERFQRGLNPNDFESTGGKLLQAQLGLSGVQLANIANGTLMHPSINAAQVQQGLAEAQKFNAYEGMRKTSPLTPEQNRALSLDYEKQKYTNEQIAQALATGGVYPKQPPLGSGEAAVPKGEGSVRQRASDEEFSRLFKLGQAPKLAELEVAKAMPIAMHPTLSQSFVVVDTRRNPDTKAYSTNFGGTRNEMSWDEVQAEREGAKLVDKEVYTKQISPVIDDLRKLEQFQGAIKENRGNPEGLGRVLAAMIEQLSDWGITGIDRGMSAYKAQKMLAERAIERAEKTGSIRAPDVGNLKKVATGLGVTAEDSEKAMSVIIDDLKGSLDQYMNISTQRSFKPTKAEKAAVVEPPSQTAIKPSLYSNMRQSTTPIISGLDTLDTPINQSKGWTSETAKSFQGTTSTMNGRDLAKTVIGEGLKALKSRGVKDIDRYQLTDKDTPVSITQKMEAIDTLLQSDASQKTVLPDGSIRFDRRKK